MADQPTPTIDISRIFTKDELAKYKGTNEEPKIYLAMYVKSQGHICVFDVTPRSDMYAPGNGYHCLTGRDASRALATMNLREESSNIDDLPEDKLKVLKDWGDKFLAKYNIVGILEG